MFESLKMLIKRTFEKNLALDDEELLNARYERFLQNRQTRIVYFKPKHKNGRKDNLQYCNAFPARFIF